jgi:hypothetical protein
MGNILCHLIVISGRPVFGPNNLKQKKDEQKQDGSEWNDGKMADSGADLLFLPSRLAPEIFILHYPLSADLPRSERRQSDLIRSDSESILG